VLSAALTVSLSLLAFGMPAERPRDVVPAPNALVVRMLPSDMTAPGEVRPHGVPPSYDWANGPRPRRSAPPADFTAVTAWGQLYRCAGAPADRDDTIELRDLQLWTLIGGRWKQAQQPSVVDGSSFPESYMGRPVAARVVARGRTSTSVRMRAGYNFHFWPGTGRVRFDARKVQALAVIVTARRIAHGRASGCVALNVGADYWRSISAPAAGSANANDAGIGRFKRVTRRWRAFSMTTASAQTLTRHPLRLRVPASELW
jgi:hypothetical protein